MAAAIINFAYFKKGIHDIILFGDVAVASEASNGQFLAFKKIASVWPYGKNFIIEQVVPRNLLGRQAFDKMVSQLGLVPEVVAEYDKQLLVRLTDLLESKFDEAVFCSSLGGFSGRGLLALAGDQSLQVDDLCFGRWSDVLAALISDNLSCEMLFKMYTETSCNILTLMKCCKLHSSQFLEQLKLLRPVLRFRRESIDRCLFGNQHGMKNKNGLCELCSRILYGRTLEQDFFGQTGLVDGISDFWKVSDVDTLLRLVCSIERSCFCSMVVAGVANCEWLRQVCKLSGFELRVECGIGFSDFVTKWRDGVADEPMCGVEGAARSIELLKKLVDQYAIDADAIMICEDFNRLCEAIKIYSEKNKLAGSVSFNSNLSAGGNVNEK